MLGTRARAERERARRARGQDLSWRWAGPEGSGTLWGGRRRRWRTRAPQDRGWRRCALCSRVAVDRSSRRAPVDSINHRGPAQSGAARLLRSPGGSRPRSSPLSPPCGRQSSSTPSSGTANHGPQHDQLDQPRQSLTPFIRYPLVILEKVPDTFYPLSPRRGARHGVVRLRHRHLAFPVTTASVVAAPCSTYQQPQTWESIAAGVWPRSISACWASLNSIHGACGPSAVTGSGRPFTIVSVLRTSCVPRRAFMWMS